MNYLSLSTADGTVCIAKAPIHWIWAYDEDQGDYDVQIVFQTGEILDLSFESEEARKIPMQMLLDFLVGD